MRILGENAALTVTVKSPCRGDRVQLCRTRCAFQCVFSVFPELTRVRTRYRSLIFVFAPRRAGRPAGRLLQLDKSAFFQGRRRVCGVRMRKERNIYAGPIYRPGRYMEMRECALFSNSKADVPKPMRRSYRPKRQRGFNNRRKAARLILLRKKHRRIFRISFDYHRRIKRIKKSCKSFNRASVLLRIDSE